MSLCKIHQAFLVAIACIAASLASSANGGPISIAMVPVGDPGNAPDTQIMNDGTTGYGKVNYVYQIGKYDVTTDQYATFLNSVAATDPYGLYNSNMATGAGGVPASLLYIGRNWSW